MDGILKRTIKQRPVIGQVGGGGNVGDTQNGASLNLWAFSVGSWSEERIDKI